MTYLPLQRRDKLPRALKFRVFREILFEYLVYPPRPVICDTSNKGFHFANSYNEYPKISQDSGKPLERLNNAIVGGVHPSASDRANLLRSRTFQSGVRRAQFAVPHVPYRCRYCARDIAHLFLKLAVRVK